MLENLRERDDTGELIGQGSGNVEEQLEVDFSYDEPFFFFILFSFISVTKSLRGLLLAFESADFLDKAL